MEIKVSAVIPCYNQGVFVKECVLSLLNQTYKIDEILVIDDGSSEDITLQILNNLDYPNTKVYFQKNSGPSRARNIGFQKTKNDWVITIDADDYFETTFVEKAVKIIETSNQLGAVTCWVKFFGRFNHIWECKGGSLDNFLIKNNSSSAAIINKTIWSQIEGYDEKLSAYEDWDFWIRLTSLGYHVHVIEEPLFFYRKHSISLLEESEKNYIKFYNYILQKNEVLFTSNYVTIYLSQFEELKALKAKIRFLENYSPISLMDLYKNCLLYIKRYLLTRKANK